MALNIFSCVSLCVIKKMEQRGQNILIDSFLGKKEFPVSPFSFGKEKKNVRT